MADNVNGYSYTIDSVAEAVLKRGPVSVENTLNILYLAAKNPIIHLHGISDDMLQQAKAAVTTLLTEKMLDRARQGFVRLSGDSADVVSAMMAIYNGYLAALKNFINYLLVNKTTADHSQINAPTPTPDEAVQEKYDYMYKFSDN